MTRAWLLLVLAGCGAAAPAPPARPTSTASLIDALEAAADRACACADRDCAAIVEEDLQAQLAAPTPPLLDDPQFARAEEAMQRGIACLWKREVIGYAYESLSTQAFDDVRDEVCACADEACLLGALQGHGSRLLHLSAVPMTEAATDAQSAINEATSACTRQTLAHTPAIVAAAALRDTACACAIGDTACGGAAATELRAFFSRYDEAALSGLVQSQLVDLGAEIGKCLARAGVSELP